MASPVTGKDSPALKAVTIELSRVVLDHMRSEEPGAGVYVNQLHPPGSICSVPSIVKEPVKPVVGVLQ